MPPKRSEVAIVVEPPEQPPTLIGNPLLVSHLLGSVDDHAEDVAATVAAALGMDDYLVNLQHGVVVDMMVETIHVCARANMKANKTTAVLELVESLRASILATGTPSEARSMFRAFFMRHATESTKEKKALQAAALAAAQQAEAQSIEPEKPAAPAATEGKKKDVKGQKKVVEEAVLPPPPPIDAGPHFLDAADTAEIAQHIFDGVLYHWRLYCLVGSIPRSSLFECPASEQEEASSVSLRFTVGLQAPMPSHPLTLAVPLQEYERGVANDAARAARERAELEAVEAAEVAAERAALAAAQERRRLQAEEERNSLLYIKKATTSRAAEELHQTISSELADRQRRIEQRIMKLEESLHLSAN